ncbi:MAG: TerB family tellurite resistance protein [Nannocystaceae bacterium]
MNLGILFDIAQKAHEYSKKHHTIPVTVVQRDDDLGVGLEVVLDAALPRGALLFGWVKGIWLGRLTAVDGALFRDNDGDFLTIGPIEGQRGRIYIPYGAAQSRGAGLYSVEMGVQLVDSATARVTEVGQATYKIALGGQPTWSRIEFFRPFITLCMTVIRSDGKTTSREIRGLRELFDAGLPLSPEDAASLRSIMKVAYYGDLRRLVESVRLRLPTLSPEGLLGALTYVARLDGAVNVHEFSILHQIAAALGLTRARCAEVVHAPPAEHLMLRAPL